MILSFLSAAVLQAAPAPPLDCSLVTPGAHQIELNVASDGVALPASGSIWPLTPSRGIRSGGKSRRIVFGGRGGVALDTGAMEAGQTSSIAMLSRWDGRRLTYPVAVGSCRLAAAPAAAGPTPPAAQAATNIPAFDPAGWPQDCGMLLSDGRRVRFDYTIAGPNGPVRLQSPVLWGNKPVETRRTGNRFGGRTGPAGAERMLGHDAVRVKIIHFSRIGDPAVSAQAAIGICGYNNVVRRPNTQ
jgi:hypothetical protein